MSKKGCGQVRIPTVDNTELECDEYISSKCVRLKYNSILTEDVDVPLLYHFVKKFDEYVKDRDLEIRKLQVENKKLSNEVRKIKRDFSTLKSFVNKKFV